MSKPTKKVQSVFDILHYTDKRYELKNICSEWLIHLKYDDLIDIEINVFKYHKWAMSGAVYFIKRDTSRVVRGTQVNDITIDQLERVIGYGVKIIESDAFDEKTDKRSYFDGNYGFRKVR